MARQGVQRRDDGITDAGRCRPPGLPGSQNEGFSHSQAVGAFHGSKKRPVPPDTSRGIPRAGVPGLRRLEVEAGACREERTRLFRARHRLPHAGLRTGRGVQRGMLVLRFRHQQTQAEPRLRNRGRIFPQRRPRLRFAVRRESRGDGPALLRNRAPRQPALPRFRQGLQKNYRIRDLHIDRGPPRRGVAALPHSVLPRGKPALAEIERTLKGYDVQNSRHLYPRRTP